MCFRVVPWDANVLFRVNRFIIPFVWMYGPVLLMKIVHVTDEAFVVPAGVPSVTVTFTSDKKAIDRVNELKVQFTNVARVGLTIVLDDLQLPMVS